MKKIKMVLLLIVSLALIVLCAYYISIKITKKEKPSEPVTLQKEMPVLSWDDYLNLWDGIRETNSEEYVKFPSSILKCGSYYGSDCEIWMNTDTVKQYIKSLGLDRSEQFGVGYAFSRLVYKDKNEAVLIAYSDVTENRSGSIVKTSSDFYLIKIDRDKNLSLLKNYRGADSVYCASKDGDNWTFENIKCDISNYEDDKPINTFDLKDIYK